MDHRVVGLVCGPPVTDNGSDQGNARRAGDVSEGKEHPVLTGLIALVTVGLVVGLIVGMAAMAATGVLGLSGGGGKTKAVESTMFLPRPEKTTGRSDPLVTLPGAPEPSTSATSDGKPGDKPTKKHTAAPAILLNTATAQVAPMEPIDLSGTYQSGEGAVLTVQRFEGGQWVDFAGGGINALVSAGGYSTYVQTGQAGINKFRMADPATGRYSNVVKVRVG